MFRTDSIRNGIRFQPTIASAFLAQLAKAKLPKEQKILDVWVVALLYELQGNTSKLVTHITIHDCYCHLDDVFF